MEQETEEELGIIDIINELCAQVFQYEDEINHMMASEILRLIKRFESHIPNSSFYFSSLKDICSEQLLDGTDFRTHVQSPHHTDRLHTHFIRLHKGRQLGSNPYVSFILATTKNPLLSEKRDDYKAFFLATLIATNNVNRTKDIRNQSIKEGRLLFDPRRKKLLAMLPNIFSMSPENNAQIFEQMLEQAESVSLYNQLEVYAKAASIIANNWDINDPEKKRNDMYPKPNYTTQGIYFRPHELDIDFDGLYARPYIDIVENINANEEEMFKYKDEDSVYGVAQNTLIFNPRAIRSDYEVEQLRSSSVNANIQRNSLLFSSSISVATFHEIKLFTQYFFKHVDEEPNLSILMLIMLTGRPVEVLDNIPWSTISGFISSLKVEYVLPSTKIENTALNTIKTDKSFTILLPRIISSKILPKLKIVSHNELETLIRELNRELRTYLTLSKLTMVFSQFCRMQGIDTVIEGVLRGAEVASMPAAFYTQINVKRLFEVYERYCSYLSQVSGKELQLNEALFNQEHSVGSTIPISESCLLTILSDLQSSIIDRLAELPYSEYAVSDLADTHNMIVYHICNVLAFCSGYRPVLGWFGSIDDIDLTNGFYWISDKESLDVDTSRMIKLPHTCIAIIESYLVHCRSALELPSLLKLNSRLYNRFKQALSGEKEFLFFIDEEKPVLLSGKSYLSYADSFNHPFKQANWARHQSRTYAMHKGIHSEIIDQWFGHNKYQYLHFGHFSSLSLGDLSQITSILESFLQDHGIIGFAFHATAKK